MYEKSHNSTFDRQAIRDLRRSLARDHRKTTWTLDDFLTTLRRELQVMEQDKPKEVNFLTNYNPIREQPSAPTKHKTQQHNTKLDTQRKATYTGQKEPHTGVLFPWIITSRQRLP